ncbi:MAG: hypothetical protein ABL907_10695 [Hyphomicrobium sp.]
MALFAVLNLLLGYALGRMLAERIKSPIVYAICAVLGLCSGFALGLATAAAIGFGFGSIGPGDLEKLLGNGMVQTMFGAILGTAQYRWQPNEDAEAKETEKSASMWGTPQWFVSGSTQLLVLLAIGVGLAVAAWMFLPDERDRWSKADGVVACNEEKDIAIIGGMTLQESKHIIINRLVKPGQCSQLFANERVRVFSISKDSKYVEVVVERTGLTGWMEIASLKPRPNLLFAYPWFPVAKHAPLSKPQIKCSWNDLSEHCRIQRDNAEVKAEPTVTKKAPDSPEPRLGADGQCTDWNHALTFSYFDECRRRHSKYPPTDSNSQLNAPP